MQLIKKLFALILVFNIFHVKADTSLDVNTVDEYADTLLYAVSGPDIQDSYLFGTMHILPKDKMYLPAKVNRALEQVDKLVLELDMDDSVQLAQMMSLSLLPDGQHVYDFMTDAQWQTLQQSWQEIYGGGSQKYSRIKPFLLISFLLKKYVGQTPASYELSLMQMAHAKGKPVEGLETVMQQMGFIDDISIDKQIEMLMRYIDEEQEMVKEFHDMMEMYLNEDVDALNELMQKYYDEDPQVLEALLDARNRSWVKTIKDMAQHESALFAFGAGHLSGENGMLSLLEQAGYTVTPIGEKSDE